jgi:mono/diheme cytochrome c family protein
MIMKSMPAGTAVAVSAMLAVTAFATPASAETLLERGEYLVRGPMACGNCHSPLGPEGPVAGQELAGRLVEKTDQFEAIAPNITPAGNVGKWSDAELARAIREGIRPDGSVIGPPMPFTFYRDISDTDLAAIVAFLRTVPAVENDPGKSSYSFPLPPAYGPPVASVADIARGPTAEYGKYVAGPLAHCLECHSPITPQGPDLTKLGQGGYEFHGPWGVSVAANLTSSADGIAGWTDEQLAAMIIAGKRPDGTAMLPPMPYANFARMAADDVTAVIAYLRTLPPLPDPQ